VSGRRARDERQATCEHRIPIGKTMLRTVFSELELKSHQKHRSAGERKVFNFGRNFPKFPKFQVSQWPPIESLYRSKNSCEFICGPQNCAKGPKSTSRQPSIQKAIRNPKLPAKNRIIPVTGGGGSLSGSRPRAPLAATSTPTPCSPTPRQSPLHADGKLISPAS
jgi:hypothetical protein